VELIPLEWAGVVRTWSLGWLCGVLAAAPAAVCLAWAPGGAGALQLVCTLLSAVWPVVVLIWSLAHHKRAIAAAAEESRGGQRGRRELVVGDCMQEP
jgi:hypothetical protein